MSDERLRKKRLAAEKAHSELARAKERFDLVVCQGVLPYLDDDAYCAAADAIESQLATGTTATVELPSGELRIVLVEPLESTGA